MVLGLIVYLLGRDKYLPGIGLAPEHRQDAETAVEIGELGIPSYGRNAAVGAAGGVIVAILASVQAWSTIGMPAWVLSLSGLMSLAYGIIIGAAFTVALLGTQGEERNRVWALVMVSFFVVFFWLVFEQAGSSLTLFADRDTDLTPWASLFGLERIPASWFAEHSAALHHRAWPVCRLVLDVSAEASHGTGDQHEDGVRAVSRRHRLLPADLCRTGGGCRRQGLAALAGCRISVSQLR